MRLKLSQKQAIQATAKILYDFLPGKAHPYADQNISFKQVAQDVGVGPYWVASSKLPSIITLLEGTLENKSDRFCKLIVEIVSRGLVYTSNKSPIYKETIVELNSLIKKLGYKIPELWDQNFLDSLPGNIPLVKQEKSVDQFCFDKLRSDLLEIVKMSPQARGFAFESFLNALFKEFGLEPRSPFRITGEQIDGSIQLEGATYLIEAKWHNKPIGNTDLLAFRGKVDEKSVWTRGVFISHSGFSEDGLTAFSKGNATNIIGISGEDIYFLLDNNVPLDEIIRKKVRMAAETGEFYTPSYAL